MQVIILIPLIESGTLSSLRWIQIISIWTIARFHLMALQHGMMHLIQANGMLLIKTGAYKSQVKLVWGKRS